jgi:hypothetical protein
MKNLRWLAVFWFAVAISFANSAQAQIAGPEYKDTVDNGCSSVDTGTSGCFGYGADGANGGTAGGMSACTAYRYCVTCARPVGATRSICIEARRSGSCTCTANESGPVFCASGGACTYKGQ